jgi:para-aminobenzoate synthetase/4-amino-4-deoxychorismate lyase
LKAALAWVAEQTGSGRWVAAALDYELGGVLEPRAAGALLKTRERPLARFWSYAEATDRDPAASARWLDDLIERLPPARRVAGISSMAPALTADEHAVRVRKIQRLIAEGECYQVNLTFPLYFTPYGDSLALYRLLQRRQPTAHGALIYGADGCAVMSLSPELFVERRSARLRVRPMKGTATRGRDAVEDTQCATRLALSVKDRAENVMIVDLLRSDLGRIARPGSVKVTRLCEIERYPSVLQMTSTVEAEAATDDLFKTLAALFPCGSVTGAPKIRAMQIIDDLEATPRGLYCGSLGWFAPDGDFSLNVAIRSFEMTTGQPTQMGIGSGIVADSDAADEYRECLTKARFLTQLDPGFQLIETLRLDAGHYPRLSGHLTRLMRSAKALGFGFQEDAVRQCLAACAEQHPRGLWRVRLTLDHGGKLSVTAEPLVDSSGSVTVLLAQEQIDAAWPLQRHKTTVRGHYDTALARAVAAGHFDALFLNTRGELAEGARSTVFVRPKSGDVLLTPPLASGALPGVFRADLLARGEAREAVLTLRDVQAASEVYLGNALRGLLPAIIVAAGFDSVQRVEDRELLL